jgi:hypothetical protein
MKKRRQTVRRRNTLAAKPSRTDFILSEFLVVAIARPVRRERVRCQVSPPPSGKNGIPLLEVSKRSKASYGQFRRNHRHMQVYFYFKENMLLFGGFSKSSMNPIHQTTTFYNEMHLYNSTANSWEEVILNISTLNPTHL